MTLSRKKLRKIAARKAERNRPHPKRAPVTRKTVTEITVMLPIKVVVHGDMPKDLDPHALGKALALSLDEVEDGNRNHGTDGLDLILPGMVKYQAERLVDAVFRKRYADRMVPSGPMSTTSLIYSAARKRMENFNFDARCGYNERDPEVTVVEREYPARDFQPELNF